MPTMPYRGVEPRIAADAFIAPGAWVIGDVELGPEASAWFGAVIRGDSAHVRVGARTNVQDGAVLHTDPGTPCVVGEECTIGHLAIVHACSVGDRSLVAMGATVLSGAAIGEGSLVAAGSVVLEGAEFPPGSLIVGTPARLARVLRADEAERLAATVRNYLGYAAEYGAWIE